MNSVESGIVQQLDVALHAQGANFKLLHPLLIGKYGRMGKHFRDDPFDTVGLDIETVATTGEPKLMGFSYGHGYHSLLNPTLETFFPIVKNIIDNAPGASLSVWGNLDIQCILRLFDPTMEERLYISRGISANFKNGEFEGSPPIVRYMGKDATPFFVDHYIAGRSLRLGMVAGGRAWTLWIFNLSQFYQGTISQTAQGLGMDWVEYPKNTHIVNWTKFENGVDEKYIKNVYASNKQDAVVARDLSYRIQETFAGVFGAYPKILVSVGSLADAAVSKLLSADEYQSNNWRWLCYNVWQNGDETAQAETLLAECFSAGYVDQFGLGYFPEVHMADIAAAYPDKIRKLPDLRESKMLVGKSNFRGDLARLKSEGMTIFTAIIRGTVDIPRTLKYHPITVKTADRQNVRPVGIFNAGYILEEREFCARHGAKFTNEEYTIFYMDKVVLAPIAKISRKLRVMRDGYLESMKNEKDENAKLLWDGMQYLTKIVDNSLYGKTVMTTPIVQDINDTPKITGYRAGDRFNMLYGTVITGRTRVQIADACMAIDANGGKPILAMTDSIFWNGPKTALPERLWRAVKTPGFFEAPETFEDFYIIKTGQYEYRKGKKFVHKMRGLNIPYENRKSDQSYYRMVIKDHAKTVSKYSHAADFAIPVNTRRLVTIGSYDLHKLGLVEDKTAMMKPFVLSGKQSESYVVNWNTVLDGHIWLDQIIAFGDIAGDSPLAFLRGLYERGDDYLTTYQRKRLYYYLAAVETEKLLPKGVKLTNCSIEYLEDYFGLKWDDLVTYGSEAESKQESAKHD